jgi:hypothetical protein
MELWQMITGLIITAAAVITAMKTLTAPIRKKLDEVVSVKERVVKLEAWTEKQQEDLQDVSKRVGLTFDATLALLDHTIIKQGGNGDCHKAQDAMNEYIQGKISRLKSYKAD